MTGLERYSCPHYPPVESGDPDLDVRSTRFAASADYGNSCGDRSADYIGLTRTQIVSTKSRLGCCRGGWRAFRPRLANVPSIGFPIVLHILRGLRNVDPQLAQECSSCGVKACTPVSKCGCPHLAQLTLRTRAARCGRALCAMRIRIIVSSIDTPSIVARKYVSSRIVELPSSLKTCRWMPSSSLRRAVQTSAGFDP
jgi:hypothetical protein